MITVLGLGNILLKDEGFGVHFIRWFEKRHDLGPAVEIVDGGTLGFVLLDLVCKSEYLVVVDAIRVDARSGSLFRFTPEDLPPEYLTQGAAHDAAFLQVLLQAEMLHASPRECVIIGIVPEDIKGLGLTVTPALESKFAEVEEQVLKELERWGVTANRYKAADTHVAVKQ